MTSITTLFLSIFLVAGSPVNYVETVISRDDIPPLNKKVLEFVDDNMDKKVDRGECWDLAYKSLMFAGAHMEDTYVFGKEVFPGKDKIYPGDILQMWDVKYTWGGSTSQHTAVIYEVLGDGKYKTAEQNVGNVRKVMIRDFDVAEIEKGKLHFYRPVAQ